jgi:hypothetical protein
MSKNEEDHLIRVFRGDGLEPHQKSKLFEELMVDPAQFAAELAEQDALSDSTIAETLRLATDLAKSRLFPIKFHRASDSELILASDRFSEVEGSVMICSRERGKSIPLSFECGEHFDQIVVSGGGLPAGVRPLCIVLTRLVHYRREPAVGPVSLGTVREMQPLRLVADDFVDAEDEGEPTEQKLFAGESPDLDWELEVDTLSLHVSGDVPADRDLDTVIADLRLEDETGRQEQQVRPVALRVKTDGSRRMGNTGFDWPDLAGAMTGELTVRSLEDADMHLLAPRQAMGCLAAAGCHFAFPLQRKGDNWVFEMGGLDREAVAREKGATWFLQAVGDT